MTDRSAPTLLRRLNGTPIQARMMAARAPMLPHAPAVYLADEPEAHLHPAALQSVREWLTQLAETAAAVLVATHSTALLDSASELVHRVLVFPGDEGTELRRLSGALADQLARVSAELGISKGEILLMTRLAVFVEGPHDKIILDEWFGDDLRAAGIRAFPVHGVDNLPGLADSEIASALGIRMATLSDDTSVRRSAARRARTRARARSTGSCKRRQRPALTSRSWAWHSQTSSIT